MDTISSVLREATPFLMALTALLVAMQGFQIHHVKKQTNGLMKSTQDMAQEKGRAEESTAASHGQTTVGTPLK